MERLKVRIFAAAQGFWIAIRTLGRAALGAERFDRLIDKSGLHRLKNRSWVSRRILPDGNDIFYRPHDQCIIEEVYDRDLYSRERIAPGQTVVDAGAHIGIFTLMAARRVGPTGRVLAFEPSPHTQETLRRNLSLNGLPWVKLHPVALSDAEGTAPFFVAADGVENPVADSLQASPNRAQVRVRVRRLDAVLAEEGITSVDLLKIDVEGAELRLMDGAPQALARAQRVVMEVHPPEVDPAEVRRRFEALGYSCRIATGVGCILLEAVRSPAARP